MKILIVEDNSDMRDLLALRVQLTGYLPILANDGKEGVEKANAEKPDLILMDMMMPVTIPFRGSEVVFRRRLYWLHCQTICGCGSPAQNPRIVSPKGIARVKRISDLAKYWGACLPLSCGVCRPT
jgi:hypothetical protein